MACWAGSRVSGARWCGPGRVGRCAVSGVGCHSSGAAGGGGHGRRVGVRWAGDEADSGVANGRCGRRGRVSDGDTGGGSGGGGWVARARGADLTLDVETV